MAESIVRNLYSEYKRHDLSYVWIGIPLAKMEYMKRGETVFEENFFLSEDDRFFLEQVIRHYSHDAFLDHAYYFLHEFEMVIDKFPNSLILDLAYLSAAKKYGGVKATELYLKYLQKWPNSARKIEVVYKLFLSYLNSGNLIKAIETKRKYGINDELYKSNLAEHFSTFVERMGLQYVLEILERYNLLTILNNKVWEFNLDEGEKFYVNGEYESALEVYTRQKDLYIKYEVPVPVLLQIKAKELQKIIEFKKDRSAKGLLKLGIYLRDEVGSYFNRKGRNNHAIIILKECYLSYPNSVEAQKSLYLISSSYRRLEEYDNSYQTLIEFTKKYPDSTLIDDVLTEIGVHFLHVKWNFDRAKKYFEEVVNYYPKSNAADNALNWIALYYLKNHQYAEAFAYYSLLSKSYTNNRIGKIAIDTVNKLKLILESKVKKNTIVGLEIAEWAEGVYIKSVSKNSLAFQFGLAEGDIIRKINSTVIYSASVVSHK